MGGGITASQHYVSLLQSLIFFLNALVVDSGWTDRGKGDLYPT